MGLRTSASFDLLAANVLGRVPVKAFRAHAKRRAELAYWKRRHAGEAGLRGDHYERFFTEFFGLSRADYDGKRVLDIGCGPRGSLEWAAGAAERVGLDPLADAYLRLGADRHGMTYVSGSAEAIPFPSGRFDVIAAFNSLDHVDNLPAAVSEIARVAAADGLFLLVTDIGHDPTFTEPQAIGWDVLDLFEPHWQVVQSRRIARSSANMMESLDAGILLEPGDSGRGYLSALLRRASR